MRASLSSNTTRPVRSGALNCSPIVAPSRGSRSMRCDLRQPLGARLRLARLRGLRAKALDEALHARDLRLLLVDRLAERDLARGLLAAPAVPGAREVARPARPRARAPPCRRPPGTSGRGRPARPPRRGRRASARAIPATRCRGGWWARRAAARRRRSRARGPATRASARRRRSVSSERGRGRRRRSPGRAPSRARGRATDSRRAPRAAPARARSARASPRRSAPCAISCSSSASWASIASSAVQPEKR